MLPLALPSSLGGWSLLTSGAVYTLASLWYVVRACLTLAWPSTTGRITVRRPDGTPSHYITYSYTVGSDLFVNDQVAVGQGFGLGPELQFPSWLAKRYPHSDAVTVYYNPARPADSVLRPGLSLASVGNLMFGIGMVVLALLGAT